MDNSGVKLYLTKDYRKTEFGIVTLGANSDWAGLLVPPLADKFDAEYACRKDCLNVLYIFFKINIKAKWLCIFFEKNLFDNDKEEPEIKIFSAMPHTHLIGKIKILHLIIGNKNFISGFLLSFRKRSFF